MSPNKLLSSLKGHTSDLPTIYLAHSPVRRAKLFGELVVNCFIPSHSLLFRTAGLSQSSSTYSLALLRLCLISSFPESSKDSKTGPVCWERGSQGEGLQILGPFLLCYVFLPIKSTHPQNLE